MNELTMKLIEQTNIVTVWAVFAVLVLAPLPVIL